MVRDSEWVRVENEKVVGNNVISFELALNKEERFFAVGCYFPPSDKKGEARKLAEKALRERPKGTMPLVLGDLNVNLDVPRNEEEESLSQEMGEHGLECATRHFQVRRRRHVRGRWTWRRAKGEATRAGDRRWVRSRPDYILFSAQERRRIKRCRWVLPPHHNSDHRALIVKVWGSRGIKRYVKERETLLVQPPEARERLEGKEIFTRLAATISKPEKKNWAVS